MPYIQVKTFNIYLSDFYYKLFICIYSPGYMQIAVLSFGALVDLGRLLCSHILLKDW